MKKPVETSSGKKFVLWQIGLPFLMLANLAYIPNNVVGWAVTLCFFLFVPGYLLLSLLKHEIQSRWEIASFSLGLSILLLMLGGLLLNTLSIFGLKQPLTTIPIFSMLDVLTCVLLMCNGNKTVEIPPIHLSFSLKHSGMTVLLTLLPLLGAGGAVSLNNGGSNILTMILFGLLPCVFILLIWRKEMKSLYPYAVFTMGLAVLLSTSLRGWLITGHDIRHEFSTFQLTSTAGLWFVRTATGDPYNACLSITILPTIIAKITGILPVYVYKAVFQMIFAFGLVAIYSFIKKLSNERHALIGAFICISFPAFLNDITFLNRQEIAFVFFELLLVTMFIEMARKPKIILTMLILLGLILSHYSTTYVTLGILLLSWVFYHIVKRLQLIKQSFIIPTLSLPVIILAIVVTIVWHAGITASTNGFVHTMARTINDFKHHTSSKALFVKYSLFSSAVQSPQEEFTQYVHNSDNQAQYVPQQQLPLTTLGKKLATVVSVKTLNNAMHAFVAQSYQVLLFLGIVITFFWQRKKMAQKELYFFVLTLSSLVLLILFTLLPALAMDYSIIRLLLQALIITGLSVIMASEFLFFFLKRFKIYAAAGFFVVLFLHSSGFVPQLLGEFPPQLSLNNAGLYYDFFYSHQSDVLATQWLAANRDKKLTIFVDTNSASPLLQYHVYSGLINNPKGKTPSNSSGYVYQDFTNVTKGVYRVILNDIDEYTDPGTTANRNLVYTNQFSRIYGKR